MNATSGSTKECAHRWALGAVLTICALGTSTSYAHDPSPNRAYSDNPSGQLYASPSQVRIVQEKLNEKGRHVSVDGVWGPGTIAEVRSYQRTIGLAPTGQLDTSLLSVLEIGAVLKGQTASGFLDGLLHDGKANTARVSGVGAPIYVSPVHVAHIQHLLREEGHYAGAIDGTWGAATALAANKFREAHSLEASEGLDITLLRALNQRGSVVPNATPAVVSRGSGVPLIAGPVALRALQRELAKDGQDAGAVDGVWGENTRQAVRAFQKQHDLERTGTLTLPTLAALGIDLTGGRAIASSEDANKL